MKICTKDKKLKSAWAKAASIIKNEDLQFTHERRKPFFGKSLIVEVLKSQLRIIFNFHFLRLVFIMFAIDLASNKSSDIEYLSAKAKSR